MWRETPENEATKAALAKALALVLVPGGIFVFGLIYFVAPPLPPVSVVLGCYRLEGGPLIHVSPSRMTVDAVGERPRPIRIGYGKPEYMIDAEPGFSFETEPSGGIKVVDDYPMGELIQTYVRGKTRVISMILDGHASEIPRVSCPVPDRL